MALNLLGTFGVGDVYAPGILPAYSLTAAGADAIALQRGQPGGHVGYYSSGFASAGGNQTGISLSGVLGGVLGGLENIFHFPSAGPITAEPGGITGGSNLPTTTANQHPVLTGAGGSSGKAGRVGAGVPTAVGTAIVGGAAAALGIAPGLGGHRARYAPAGTKGYHMIKKGPHAGLWTRNRHRNVANIRALRRALSRAHGFERICRKVVHFVSPHKKGRAVFRRRRRK